MSESIEKVSDHWLLIYLRLCTMNYRNLSGKRPRKIRHLAPAVQS